MPGAPIRLLGGMLSFCVFLFIMTGCNKPSAARIENTVAQKDTFPEALVAWKPYGDNPVFAGTGIDTWDENIRERGYIIKEEDGYHLWYTGYRSGQDAVMALGYATSADGIEWKRHPANPIFHDSWVEDVMVVKHDSLYFMFAEGSDDIAHMLTSTDKIQWRDHGSLDIRQTNGQRLTEGPYGTPTVFIEEDVWYLFYERNDEGIWLATSRDRRRWQNVQDEPVIKKGPEPYDKFGVAMNQVIRYGTRYYAIYHGTPTEDWSLWNTDIAVSGDLINWKKFDGNPILEDNKSSGVLVDDGKGYRLYTMHPQVQLHLQQGRLPREK